MGVPGGAAVESAADAAVRGANNAAAEVDGDADAADRRDAAADDEVADIFGCFCGWNFGRMSSSSTSLASLFL